jgi:hypothetical protein
MQQAQEQLQMLAEKEQQAKEAVIEVERKLASLKIDQTKINSDKKELTYAEQLASAKLDARDAEQKAEDISREARVKETIMNAEKMLLAHITSVKDLLQGSEMNQGVFNAVTESTQDVIDKIRNTLSVSDASPSLVDALMENSQQTGEAIRQLLITMSLPKETKLLLDDQGNPTGSVSQIRVE